MHISIITDNIQFKADINSNCYVNVEIRVSVQGVKSLGGHFACLMPGV